ncbi:MAG TPA: chorismate-binding protein, partial [Chitinophagales bacterium]|nr:chorismate-binding protein [Chitinophagales bacterium]
MVSLKQFYQYCLQHNLPVAFYRLPGTNTIQVVAQKKQPVLKTITATSKGFVFAPFVEGKHERAILIQPDVYTDAAHLPPLNFAAAVKKQAAAKQRKPHAASRKEFEALVRKIRRQIRKGSFDKIVAARVALKKKPESFAPVVYYKKLCAQYPNAFATLVYTPQTGLWVGASPEILLQVKDNSFTTYSLAGTRAYTKNNSAAWGEKEKQEQQIVSGYIMQAFKKVSHKKPQVTGPETVTAGNLQHLRSTFVFKNLAAGKWKEVVKQLHPTPAVAGLPKQKAIDFILKHEEAPRSYYSGYLGPVNLNGEINLFVN